MHYSARDSAIIQESTKVSSSYSADYIFELVHFTGVLNFDRLIHEIIGLVS